MPRRAGLATAAGLILVIVALAVALPGAFTDVGGAMEEGFMLVFPERVLEGDVPNRDFLHLYGPGALWVLAAAFAIFGVSIFVERAVGALQIAGVVFGVWRWTQPWGTPLATLAALVSVVFAITPIGVVALAWTGGLALLLWGLLLVVEGVERDGARRVLVGGVLAGAALLYRPDLAAALVVAGVVLVRVLRTRQFGWHALAGLALGVAPMLVHLAMAGPVRAFEGMFLDPVFRLREGRALPLPPSSDRLDSFLQRVNELDVLEWPRPFEVPMQLRLWFFVVVVATLVVVAAAVVASRRRGDHALRLQVMAAVSVGIVPQAMQRPDSAHLAWISCFTIAVLPVAIAELLPRRVVLVRAVAPATALAVIVAVFAVIIPAFTLRSYVELALQSTGRERNAVEVEHDGRTFFVGSATSAAAVELVAKEADRITDSGDRLFVGPADLTRTPFVDTWIYHLLPDLEPATYFLEMDPGLANAPGTRLAADLASADIAIVTDTWEMWSEPNASVESGDREAARVLRSQFCSVVERDGIELLEKCGRRAS